MTESRLREGDDLSQILFNLYLNDFALEVKQVTLEVTFNVHMSVYYYMRMILYY